MVLTRNMPLRSYFIAFALYIQILLSEVNGSSMVQLTPLRCRGTLNSASAVYFSRSNELEVMGEDESVTLCDVIGINVKVGDDFYDKVIHNYKFESKFDFINACKYYVNRDKGLYDNLPYAWKRTSTSKKELYALLSGGEATSLDGNQRLYFDKMFRGLSPEQMVANSMEAVLGMRLGQLVIEVSDLVGAQAVKLGGAATVSRITTEEPSNAMKTLPPQFDGSSEQDQCTVNCHIDEVVLLSLRLGKPILMTRALFNSLSIDARITKNDEGDMTISSVSTVVVSRKDSSTPSSSTAPPVPPVPPAWDVFDPKRFLSMSAIDKRAVLRASGVSELPRPREGITVLDQVLRSMMDDSVRREVIRLSTGVASAADLASETEDQELLRSMGAALENGDTEKAAALRDRFATRRLLRADPTQARGAYDRFLDQDDWYLEARRRAMAPKKEA